MITRRSGNLALREEVAAVFARSHRYHLSPEAIARAGTPRARQLAGLDRPRFYDG